MQKAAIYVRVSTPDQHVESQLYDLRELAATRGFDVVKEYQDCGPSSRVGSSKEFLIAASGEMLSWRRIGWDVGRSSKFATLRP